MDDARNEPGRGDGGRARGEGWLGRLRRGAKTARNRSPEGGTFKAPGAPIARTLGRGQTVCLDPRAPIRACLPAVAAVVGSPGSGKRTILESVVGGLRAGERGVVLTEAGEGERWREAVPFEVDVVSVGIGSRPRLVPADGLPARPAGEAHARALVDLFAATLGTADNLSRHALLLTVRDILDPEDFLFDGLGDVAWAYRLVTGLDALRRRSEKGSHIRRAAARLARAVCREAEDPMSSIVLGTPPDTDEIEEALSAPAGDGPRLVVVEVCLAPPLTDGVPMEKLSDERRIAAALWPMLLLRILEHVPGPAGSGWHRGADSPFSLLVLPEARRLVHTPSGAQVLEWVLRESRSANTGVWLGAESSAQLEGLPPLATTHFLGREGGAYVAEPETVGALRRAGFADPAGLAGRLRRLGPGEFFHSNHLGEAGFVRVTGRAGVGGAGRI